MRTYLILFAAMLAFTSIGYTQQADNAKATATIRLNVVASDAKGKPVSGLTAADFTLLDNKMSPAPISVREVRSKGTDVHVLVVLDAVNTPYSGMSYERDEIVKYFQSHAVLEHPTSFAVLQDKGIDLNTSPSTDGTVLANALQHYDIGLRIEGRDEGFYGAEDRASISLKALGQVLQYEAKIPGRKLVIWASPGWPLLSGPAVNLDNAQQKQLFAEVVGFADEFINADVTLYNVNGWGAAEPLIRASYYQDFLDGVKKPSDAQFGNVGLQVFATRSGGLVEDSTAVAKEIERCASDADDYYQIAFAAAPTEHADTYHQLQISVTRPKVTARYPSGYYSQP